MGLYMGFMAAWPCGERRRDADCAQNDTNTRCVYQSMCNSESRTYDTELVTTDRSGSMATVVCGTHCVHTTAWGCRIWSFMCRIKSDIAVGNASGNAVDVIAITCCTTVAFRGLLYLTTSILKCHSHWTYISFYSTTRIR